MAKLDRTKIVTLEYAGKRSEAAILNQASPTDAGSPLQVERCYYGVLIEKQKDNLIYTIEKKLKQKVAIENLFTIQWKLV